MQTLVILAALAWADSPEVAAYTLSVDSKPTPATSVLKQITETPLADLPPAPEAAVPVVALRKPRAAKATHDAAQPEADGGHWCTPENCVAGCACHAQATPQAAPAPAKAAPQAVAQPAQYRVQAPAQPVYQQPVYYTYPQAGACANGQCGTTYAQPMRRGLFGRWR